MKPTNLEAVMLHLLDYWHKQTDKNLIAFNPLFLEKLIQDCAKADSENRRLNPEYFTASYGVSFDDTIPFEHPIFCCLT